MKSQQKTAALRLLVRCGLEAVQRAVQPSDRTKEPEPVLAEKMAGTGKAQTCSDPPVRVAGRLRAIRSLTDIRPATTMARSTLPRPPQPVPTFVPMANAPLAGHDTKSCSFGFDSVLSEKFSACAKYVSCQGGQISDCACALSSFGRQDSNRDRVFFRSADLHYERARREFKFHGLANAVAIGGATVRCRLEKAAVLHHVHPAARGKADRVEAGVGQGHDSDKASKGAFLRRALGRRWELGVRRCDQSQRHSVPR